MKSLPDMAALNAKKTGKEIGDYYDRKVKEGKNKMLVMDCKM